MLPELGEAMALTSICGLGQVAVAPALSILKHWPELGEELIHERTAAPPTVTLTLDGRPVTVPAGTTIWEAAQAVGTDIPALCHSPKLRPVGVCRLCVVDVGGRVLAAAASAPARRG